MTKEEFVRKVDELRAQKIQYEKEYIETNTKYPAGTKVKVTKDGKTRIGIVKYSVVEYDDVVPFINQIMKNGDESIRRISVTVDDDIEVI